MNNGLPNVLRPRQVFSRTLSDGSVYVYDDAGTGRTFKDAATAGNYLRARRAEIGLPSGERPIAIRADFGIGGQVAYTATEADGRRTVFVGSTYGTPGPVAVVISEGFQSFVTEPERFGSIFNREWVGQFLAARADFVARNAGETS
jgi:hypothetical protein